MFKLDFETNKRAWSKYIDLLGRGVRNKIRKQIMHEEKKGRGGVGLGQFYDKDTAYKLEYYPKDKVIGSPEWSIDILDRGIHPGGRFPNIDMIRAWVRFYKDDGANIDASEASVESQTFAVAQKIQQQGIEPRWYVGRVLSQLEHNGADYL